MKAIHTDKAPAAVGPYSQAIEAGGFVYVSGQLPLTDGKLVEEIKEATRQCLENLKAILEAAGTDLNHVVKTTVYLQDIGQFADMNAVYAEYFNEHKPARAAFQVAKLPLGAIVEIEAVAHKCCNA